MKLIITILIYIGFSISNTCYAAASKSELCDIAIKTFNTLITQSENPEMAKNFTKEKCMAISDQELNSAVAKLMGEMKNNKK